MAGSPTNLGFVYFAAGKAVGYTAFAYFLKIRYDLTDKPNVLLAGLARTGIGIVVGVCYGLLWGGLEKSGLFGAYSPGLEKTMSWVFLLLLAPVRIGEWMFFIWWLYDRTLQEPKWVNIICGVIWSCMIDALAIILAFASPGGFWVC